MIFLSLMGSIFAAFLLIDGDTTITLKQGKAIVINDKLINNTI